LFFLTQKAIPMLSFFFINIIERQLIQRGVLLVSMNKAFIKLFNFS
jgi:hypothetical protein